MCCKFIRFKVFDERPWDWKINSYVQTSVNDLAYQIIQLPGWEYKSNNAAFSELNVALSKGSLVPSEHRSLLELVTNINLCVSLKQCVCFQLWICTNESVATGLRLLDQ